ALNQYVTLRCYQEDYEAAEAPSLEVLSLARAELRDADPQLATAVNNRAVVLKQRGRLDDAAEMYREALRIQRLLVNRDHPETGNLLNNLAVVFRAQGKLDEAAETHGEARSLRRRVFGETHSSVAQSTANLAAVLRELGRLEDAAEAYAEAITILEQTSGGLHPMIPRLGARVASIQVELGRPELAEEMLRRDLDRQRDATAPATLLADLGSGLAAAVAAQGRYGEAESLYRESLDVLRGSYGPDHRKTRRVVEDLAALYEAWGKLAQARRLRQGP
ncbi:MAG: tetratricopeptide repeat protein, partial [Acidobacteriota bacterium]